MSWTQPLRTHFLASFILHFAGILPVGEDAEQGNNWWQTAFLELFTLPNREGRRGTSRGGFLKAEEIR